MTPEEIKALVDKIKADTGLESDNFQDVLNKLRSEAEKKGDEIKIYKEKQKAFEGLDVQALREKAQKADSLEAEKKAAEEKALTQNQEYKTLAEKKAAEAAELAKKLEDLQKESKSKDEIVNKWNEDQKARAERDKQEQEEKAKKITEWKNKIKKVVEVKGDNAKHYLVISEPLNDETALENLYKVMTAGDPEPVFDSTGGMRNFETELMTASTADYSKLEELAAKNPALYKKHLENIAKRK